MTGWMKYPFKKCPDCDYFDWDDSDAMCCTSLHDCRDVHDDCPVTDDDLNDEEAYI